VDPGGGIVGGEGVRTVTISVPHDPATVGVVRAFIAATCRAWDLGEEPSNDAKLAVTEALTFAEEERVSVEVRPGDRGGLTIRCDGIRAPRAALLGPMGVHLLEALTTGLCWEGTAVHFSIAGST
jgi:hypothetical protein